MCSHEWLPNFWSSFHGWEIDLVEHQLLLFCSGVTSPEQTNSCLKEKQLWWFHECLQTVAFSASYFLFMNYLFHHCPLHLHSICFLCKISIELSLSLSLSLPTCGVTGWVWSQSSFISKTVYMACQLASRVFLDFIVLSHIYLLHVPFLLSFSLSLSLLHNKYLRL